MYPYNVKKSSHACNLGFIAKNHKLRRVASWLLFVFVSCKNNSIQNSFQTENPSKKDSIVFKEVRPFQFVEQSDSFRFQFYWDTVFVSPQDTFRFELYHDKQKPRDYYLNAFKNNRFHYRFILNPEIFKEVLDSQLVACSVVSSPEVLFFSPRYKKLFLWFNLGLSNQEAYNKGIAGINEKGKAWFKQIASNQGFSKYRYCINRNEEALLLANHLILLETESQVPLSPDIVFSGFINSQVFFTLTNPTKGDTFVEHTFIDEWGNEKQSFYRIVQKDTSQRNLVFYNLNADTLYQLRFDGICEDESFNAVVAYGHSDSLNVGVFYDFVKERLHVFNLQTLYKRTYALCKLIPEYPQKLPFLDIPTPCYAYNDSLSSRSNKKLRLFFKDTIPTYFLFLHEQNH